MLNILPSTRKMIRDNRSHNAELEQLPKSGNRFSDKNCGKNKELEQFVEPSETKTALERFPKIKKRGENKKSEQKNAAVEQHAALKQLLRQYGLRPTRQRMVIAACLFKGETHHISADILHKQIATTGENMSVATIYNSLRHFVDAGLIHAVATCGARQWFCVSKVVNNAPHAQESYIDQGCNCQFHFDDSQHIEALEHEGFDPSLLPCAPEGYEISRIDVAIHLTKKTTHSAPPRNSN